VPIYPRAGFKAKNAYVDTVSHIVRASGARALVTLESTKSAVEEVLERETKLEKLVILEEFRDVEPDTGQLPTIEPADVCFLQFTSGSTSMPKGVVVTHANLVANAEAFLGPRGLDRRPDDVAITWLPLYHDMGLIGFVLGTLVCDIPTVLIPTEAFGRRPRIWLESMDKYGGTITFAPNFAFALVTKRTKDKDLEGLDLSRVRTVGCGAEPINPQVMRDFMERFAGAGFDANAVLPCYGMAESTLAITFHAHGTPMVTDTVDSAAMQRGRAIAAEPGAENSVELVSCGKPFSEHELRIVSENGEALGEREVGEIVCKGPSVTQSYFNNPDASAESFRDGWLHTGDLGYIADGNVYVCGRIKDLIIIRGANHYPQDIEWAVAQVQGVRRENVVAFSIMRDGEEQLVVSAEGNSRDASELRRTIAARVSETSGLKVSHVAVVRVGSLPKTSSGKVQRRRTKSLFENGELEEHAP
jgi:fatty-acyl-CoA synthase